MLESVTMAKKKKRDEVLPEGMSRRQAKLAARAAARAATEVDSRPFGGLAMETQLISLQGFVSSAYAELPGQPRKTFVVTTLPGAVAAIVRKDGAWVALQTRIHSNNPGRDLAYALKWTQTAPLGATLDSGANDGTQPALTELIPADATLDIKVCENFDWWIEDPADITPDVQAQLDHAASLVSPTELVPAAVPGTVWWTENGGHKAWVRWVHPAEEEQLLKALAVVGAAGKLTLGADTKFAGCYRDKGMLVPVFDTDPTITVPELVAPLEAVNAALTEALAALPEELTADERRFLANIKSRQVTV